MVEQSIWDSIIAIGQQQSLIEWAATIASIVYVILAAKENIWCWLFGLIGVGLSFWVYLQVQLFSDASLQVFYMVMSIYGWWMWRNQQQGHSSKDDTLEISTWTFQKHLLAILAGTVLSLAFGWFWSSRGGAIPYIDGFTTGFSILATLMVAWKILENWLYWIVIDICCVFIYWYKDLHLFAFLFLVYTLIAVVGYQNWKKQILPER